MSKLPNDSEFIEVVLGLLEKSKQQDESIQKAIKALEYEQNNLKALQNDIKNSINLGIEQNLKNNFEPIKIGTKNLIDDLNHAKKFFSLQSVIWHFGGIGLFLGFVVISLFYYFPSFDEIEARRAELTHLNAEIVKIKDLKRLQVSTCEKRLCVKVVESKCNFGKQNERYCVADLK